jgi:hypothetical protein
LITLQYEEKSVTELEKIKQAVELAEETFSFYAEYHEKKGDESSLIKAKNNRTYAALQEGSS